MRTILVTIILTLYLGQALSQPKIRAEINHVFVTVDSITYNELFKNDLLTKVLADTRELSSGTLSDSWTGKYIYGRNSFLEFFSVGKIKNTNLQLGDKFGDLGIAFKTKKSGDMDKLKGLMDSLSIPIKFETTEFERNGQHIKWNYILFINSPTIHDNFRPYVEEKTKELLSLRGFTDHEISQEITEERFREKIRGRKYDKLLDKIHHIELNLTKSEFEYLKETLKCFGFTQNRQTFSNDELKIKCSITESKLFRIKSVELSLIDKVQSKKVKISKHLTLKTNNKIARFTFKYD